jgi:DNA polymerase-3 subunit epsilon
LQLSKEMLPNLKSHGLDNICKELEIIHKDRHRAEGDAEVTVELFKILLQADNVNYIPRRISKF